MIDALWFWGGSAFWLGFAILVGWEAIRRERERYRLLDEVQSRPPLVVWLTLDEDQHIVVNTALSRERTREMLALAITTLGDLPAARPATADGAGTEVKGD